MIVPLILWILIFLFFIPFYLVMMIVLGLYRLIVNFIVWMWHEDFLGHLDSKDLTFSSDDFDGKMRKSVINCSIIEGSIPLPTFRTQVKKRILDQPIFYRLHCRPFCFMGYWYWKRTEFKIENHISLHEPSEPLTDDDLRQFLPEWNCKPFSPNSPMWTAMLVPMTSNRSAVLFKLHHMVGDGISFMKLLEHYVDPGTWTNFKTPELKSFSWLHWIYAWYYFPWGALKSYRLSRVRKGFRPSAFAGDAYTSWTTLPLDKIRMVRRSTKCQFQSVLAGILANAFQKLLDKTQRSENIPSVVRVCIPVPWPNRPDHTLSNHVAWLHADLPISGGLKSLLQFDKNVKESYISGMHGVFWQFFRGMYVIPSPLLRKYTCWGERSIPPVILSSVPGSFTQVSLCGRKVLEAYPILSLGCTMGVSACCVTCFNDKAIFIVRISKEVISSQELVDQLLNKYLHEELDAFYHMVKSDEENDKKPNCDTHTILISSS